jgi:hypothetical protein
MSARTRSLAVVAALTVGLLAPGATWSPASAASRTSAAQCVPAPGRLLTVATVPKVAGFVFAVGDQHYRTDSSGKARIAPVTCSDPEVALGPISGPIDQGNRTTAIFDGWYSSETLGRSRGNGTIYASFRQTVRVDLTLHDLDGKPIDRSAVGDIVIKGSTGAQITVPRDQSSVELDASRVVRFSNGLVSKDILWSVQSVDVDGNTAVVRGRTRFLPRHRKLIPIPLMLYSLRVHVHDVILHRSVGDQVLLFEPNGTTKSIPLGPGATGGLPALARGHYVLKATGGSIAMGFKQPVAISRAEEAELTVISYVDVAIAIGAFLLVVVGLFLIGWAIHRRDRRTGPSRGGPGGAPADAPDGTPGDLAGAAVGAGPGDVATPDPGPSSRKGTP